MLLILVTARLSALEVGSVVRIKGSETSTLVGMGLVVGLNGTGDGGDYAPAHRPLVEVIHRLIDDQTQLRELEDCKSVALVTIEATVPAQGVREGDLLDVYVSCVGPAKSLAGGRLFLIPMVGEHQNSDVMALARGAVQIEDEESPRTGKIENGAKMTRSVRARFMDQRGYIQLVVNRSQRVVDHDQQPRVTDQRPGLARRPRGRPGDGCQERVHPRARIRTDQPRVVHRQHHGSVHRWVAGHRVGPRGHQSSGPGTIVMSGDVEISPTIISHDGLTITMLKPEPPLDDPDNPVDPQLVTEEFLALDPGDRGGLGWRTCSPRLTSSKSPPTTASRSSSRCIRPANSTESW